ncbi:hypothetical protein [Spiroplasma sp. SV19]|uniref:hypothetical protein n=1 Tax=Spiroplasma sp. SV19 TaxID=2570468 RepID=UPI0024B67E1C|nr:hypothetical protein [Spiroplasma sp. SV19]
MTKEQAEFFPETMHLYQTMYNSSENIFLVQYFEKDNMLANEEIKIKLPKEIKLVNQKEYWLAINPNLISFEKTKYFNKDLYLMYRGQVKTIKKIFKSVVCFFETNNEVVLKVLVPEKELNLKKMTTIYFDKHALLIYDKIKNNLVVNI